MSACPKVTSIPDRTCISFTIPPSKCWTVWSCCDGTTFASPLITWSNSDTPAQVENPISAKNTTPRNRLLVDAPLRPVDAKRARAKETASRVFATITDLMFGSLAWPVLGRVWVQRSVPYLTGQIRRFSQFRRRPFGRSGLSGTARWCPYRQSSRTP